MEQNKKQMEQNKTQTVKVRLAVSKEYSVQINPLISSIDGFPKEFVGEPIIINGCLCRPWNKLSPSEINYQEILNLSLPPEVWQEFHDFFQINGILYKIVKKVERRKETLPTLELEEITPEDGPIELRRELELVKKERDEIKQKLEKTDEQLHRAVSEVIDLQKKNQQLEAELAGEKQYFKALREVLELMRDSWQVLLQELEKFNVKEIEIMMPRLANSHLN